MPLRPRRVKPSPARRERAFYRVTTVAGVASLVLIALVAVSALVDVASGYLAGVVLGAGGMSLAWAVDRTRRRWAQRPASAPGRSHTMNCRQAGWYRPRGPIGPSDFPRPAVRRVVPCRNTRHLGR